MSSTSGGLIPLKKRICRVCVHQDQEKYLKMVSDGVISNLEASERIGVTPQVWYNHMKFCVRNAMDSALAPNVDELSKKIVDTVFELIGQIDRTKELTNKIYNVLNDEGTEVDPKQLQSYVMLEKQLSHTIELYSKITGELKNSAVINVNNTKIEFNDFKQRVMDVICLQCKKKLADMYDEDVKKGTEGVIEKVD